MKFIAASKFKGEVALPTNVVGEILEVIVALPFRFKAALSL